MAIARAVCTDEEDEGGAGWGELNRASAQAQEEVQAGTMEAWQPLLLMVAR